MKLRKMISGLVVAGIAASMMVASVSAENAPEGVALIGFGDADWKVSFWGKDGDSHNYADYSTTATITGNGTYTISVDLSGGYESTLMDEETGLPMDFTTANSIGAMGINLWGFETASMDITSVSFDGVEYPLQGRSYTNDEDGGRRTNIYNAWAGYDASKEDHTTLDAATATSTLVDISSLGEWSTISVTFDVYGLEDTAPAAGAGDTSATTSGDSKGNADTGIEGVAVIAGLALVAAGAVVVSRKRK